MVRVFCLCAVFALIHGAYSDNELTDEVRTGFNNVLQRLEDMENSNHQILRHTAYVLENLTQLLSGSCSITFKPRPKNKCSCDTGFQVVKCGAAHIDDTANSNYYTLEATTGTWPKDGFCRALDQNGFNSQEYIASIELYNQRQTTGHPGLMYNAKDAYNFDFVYFRPHSPPKCYQTGSVVDGEVVWTYGTTGTCPTPVQHKTWFTVKVVVQNGKSSIYLNDKLVKSGQNMVMQATARAGAIAANGYNNVIYFRNLTLNQIDVGFQVVKCGAAYVDNTANNDYYILEATTGTWPKDGFCRALDPLDFDSQEYAASVELYNKQQSTGHPGLMYNAKDAYNFDFVYFRPHSPSQCYQTGSVVDGEVVWTFGTTGTCPTPVQHQTWFTVKVVVQDGKSSIHLNEQIVKAGQNMMIPATARVGVIAANGYSNVIHFRNLKVTPLSN